MLALCEAELVDRERSAAEWRLKVARFPATKPLQEFDFDLQPSVNKPLVLEPSEGDRIDQPENLLLVGVSGTVKTHPATALARAAFNILPHPIFLKRAKASAAARQLPHCSA